MKKGISLIILIITIIILIILTGAIIINTDFIDTNTDLNKLRIDIAQLESLMSSYKFRKNGIIDFSTVTLNFTSNELNQFEGESSIQVDATNTQKYSIQLYIIELEKIDAEQTNLGNLKFGETDRYLYSNDTGKVYYELGIEDNEIIYHYLKSGE